MPCNNTCEQERGSGRLCAHYHCPSCSDTWRGSDILKLHVKLCKGKQGKPGTPNKVQDAKTGHDSPAQTATETDNGIESSHGLQIVEEVETAGQLSRVSPPPISRRDKAMAAIMELAESSDEMEVGRLQL